MRLSRAAPIGWAVFAAVFAAAGLLPGANSAYLTTFTFSLLIAFILAQSWDWVGGQMGYINLGHYAFYGIGAYAFAILLTSGSGVTLAAVAALCITLAFAALAAVPMFRLRGDYFAFGTLALLPLCQILAFNFGTLTGGSMGIPLPPRYALIPAYYSGFAIAVLTLAVTALIARSRFGYALKAIRNDELAAALAGVRILPVKIAVLVLSAAFAGMAGAVQTWQLGYLDPPSAFGLEAGLIPIAMVLLGGSALLLGPLLGVLVLGIAHELILVKLTMLHTAIYGAIILLVGRFMPGGLLRAFSTAQPKPQTKTHIPPSAVPVAPLPLTHAPAKTGLPLLECATVSLAFGGNRALDNVSLRVEFGQIIGIVGPNGSGKTTLFNCISKVLEPASGEIRFEGQSLAGARPDTVSRLGIGRTHQIPRPFADLTVEENVVIPLLFRGSPTDVSRARAEARTIAAAVGLEAVLNVRADTLTLQDKKLLELARALGCKPKLLLIDEVASGLTLAGTRQFVELLRQMRDLHQITIIWVEHVMWALAETVDRLIVMDSGKVLADGPLHEVMNQEDVLRAYLGSQPAQVA